MQKATLARITCKSNFCNTWVYRRSDSCSRRQRSIVAVFNCKIMSFSNDIDTDSLAASGDGELQDFLLVEQQKAQFQAQVHRLNDICWEKCADRPSSKLDSKTETCLSNCVERFIDTSLTITQRFAQLLQKGAGLS